MSTSTSSLGERSLSLSFKNERTHSFVEPLSPRVQVARGKWGGKTCMVKLRTSTEVFVPQYCRTEFALFSIK